MNTYLIQIRGLVDVNDLNPMSPHQMTVIRMEPASTLISICTDQSGLVAILRHLHHMGLIFLSVLREGERTELEKDHDRKNDLAA
jgi:hypothetical protein